MRGTSLMRQSPSFAFAAGRLGVLEIGRKLQKRLRSSKPPNLQAAKAIHVTLPFEGLDTGFGCGRGALARHTIGLCKARKVDCRWEWTGRPQGIPLEGGRAETSGTSETSGRWQGCACAPCHSLAQSKCYRAMPFASAKQNATALCPIGLCKANATAPCHWPVRSPQAYSLCKAPTQAHPGGLGGPGGPGQGTFQRQRACAFPATGPRLSSHRPCAFPATGPRLSSHWLAPSGGSL